MYSPIIDEYIEIPSSRAEGIKIPIGITVPEHIENETCPVAVLGHGFLGSKNEEFGFFANSTGEEYDYPSIASELLSLGIGTIRIDFPGHGDSNDTFTNYTLDNCVSDLQDAYEFCMEKYAFNYEKVAYVGWSMGGKVGPMFVEQNRNIHTVVYLNPAGDNGNRSLINAKAACLDWEKLEFEAEKNGTVFNQEAYDFGQKDAVMSYEYFKQVDESNTGDLIKNFMMRDGDEGLMIYGDKDCVINPETYVWLMKESGLKYVCIPGMDHDLGLESERPDYTNMVIDLTVSFINRHIK